MNLLFIFEVDYTKKVVYDMHLLAESISLLGHKVYAIDYEEWVAKGSDSNRWMIGGKHYKILIVSRALESGKIVLIRPHINKVARLDRLSASVMQIGLINHIIKTRHIDAIVLYSVPTNGLQTVRWAKKHGVPIVFRSIDSLSQLTPHKVLKPITKMMERYVYSRVDRVLTLTPKLSEYVIGLGAKPDRVEVLPMTVDTEMFKPSDGSDIGEKWGITDNNKVILFMGTLFKFSGLVGFISVMHEILWHVPNAKLLIVGDGEQRVELERIIETKGLTDKVVITGFQPYSDMPRYINLADVCTSPFAGNDTTKDIFPGKIAQYLACGKPVVMRPLPGVVSMISGEEQGVVYTDDDMDMAMQVVSLLKSTYRREAVGAGGREYACKVHDCVKVSKRLETILGGLVEH